MSFSFGLFLDDIDLISVLHFTLAEKEIDKDAFSLKTIADGNILWQGGAEDVLCSRPSCLRTRRGLLVYATGGPLMSSQVSSYKKPQVGWCI